MQATARIFFQKAPAKRTIDDLCPVKLCITHKRDRKYYSISNKIKDHKWLFLSVDDIEKVTADNPRGKYRDIATEYKRITDNAEDIINGIERFSFNQFEQKFFNQLSTWDSVFVALVSHIKTLKDEDRFGYAESFQSTLRAIKEFNEGKELSYNSRQKVETRFDEYLKGKALNFIDITPKWLKDLENWLIKKGKSRSTIGIYCRNIRTIFNIAISEHDIRATYPFKEYKPKTSTGRKIALTAGQISSIANYKTKDPQEQFCRDLFMFSFLGCGMNLNDIARLKYSNIVDGEIWYTREKTKNTEYNEDKIRVPITRTMKTIINRYGNKAVGYDAYIFPVLRPEMSEETKYLEIKKLTKLINNHLRNISGRLKIKEEITSYCSRHSWATIAKNSGTSTEFISEALGHSSVRVTKGYLKSFEKSTREEHSEKMEEIVYKQINAS